MNPRRPDDRLEVIFLVVTMIASARSDFTR
jgi:hypothetical protein